MKTLLAIAGVSAIAASALAQTKTGNVIFFHPDGTGANHWAAARMYWAGPDGQLNWDRLPRMALYRGHMENRLVGSSNGGATTHAFGYKVDATGSYGKDGDGSRNPPTDRFIKGLSGYPGSLMREAANKGYPVGIVNDGNIGEPGTGAFLAEVGNRNDWNAIALQILKGRPGQNDRQPHVILGGGERNFVPTGAATLHSRMDFDTGAYETGGKRTDGRNLIAEARADGYVVIRTRAELQALRDRLGREPNYAPKVLGLFAYHHLFNDTNEEQLKARGLVNPQISATDKRSNLYLWGMPSGPSANPPTFAEMTDVALIILNRVAQRTGKPFFLVAEPESCDNFGNNNNAIGSLSAVKRADDAIGVALRFLQRAPNTLIVTAADSDAGGIQVVEIGRPADNSAPNVSTVDLNEAEGAPEMKAPLDGLTGRGTRAFEAAPDQFGRRLLFGLSWIGGPDVGGAILSRAAGMNSQLLTTQFAGRFDNVDVYRLKYYTLFGRMLPYPTGRPATGR